MYKDFTVKLDKIQAAGQELFLTPCVLFAILSKERK